MSAYARTATRAGLLAVLAITGVVQLAVVLYFCSYGLDFTDEGVYLVSISIPETYRVSSSLFGFVYKPLYLLLQGDVAAIRRANLLLTALLTWALCLLALRPQFPQGASRAGLALLVTSFSLSTLSLAQAAMVGATPSYNFLAFQAMTLVFCGLLLLDASRPIGRLGATLAIGIGGWLAFMAKPTTALALALATPLYAIAIGGLSHLASLLGAAVVAGALVLGSALAIDGSTAQFVQRLERSMTLMRELGGGHDLTAVLRIDGFPVSDLERAATTAAILTIMILSIALHHGSELTRRLAICACALIGLATAYAMVRGLVVQINAWILFTISAFVALVGCVWRAPAIPRKTLALALLLLTAPHIFAFGTNNNYWIQGNLAALYWVLAAAVLIGPGRVDKEREALALAPLVLVAQLILALILNDMIARPYRQPHTLRENASSLRLGERGEVVLSDGFAKYIADARRVATAAGLPPGAPMIDLTGQSPGLLYALGARGLGLAWMTGGYPGSDAYTSGALDTVGCNDLAAAWLLAEQGARSLTFDVIVGRFGAQRSDYLEVGTFNTAFGAGGYPQRTQWLLKPVRSPQAAAQACETARSQRKAEAAR